MKDDNETFRRNIASLEEENKLEKTAKTLLKNQLESEQAKYAQLAIIILYFMVLIENRNGARINKLEYDNKQLLLEVWRIQLTCDSLPLILCGICPNSSNSLNYRT